MALNAVHNERLECPSTLLDNLICTSSFILDVCVCKQSVFYFISGFNLLHSRVKAILRHGARIKHHLIFAQPSYAVFDTWLENTLLDHTLRQTLLKQKENLKKFYYDWAFVRQETLFQSLIDCLYCLSARDFNVLNNIPALNLGRSQISIEMPINGNPVPLTQSNCSPSEDASHINLTQDVSHTSKSHPRQSCPNISIERSRSNIQSIQTQTQRTVQEEDEGPSPTHIPAFSYSYGSPIVAPDFSQLDDQPRLDPMIDAFRNKKEEMECPTPVVVAAPAPPKSFLESGGFVQPAALGNFPLPQKGQSLTSFLSSLSDTSQPELDRENAHFNVSEALISAFETMKMKQKAEELQEQRHLERMQAMFGETIQSSHTVFPKKKFPLSGTSFRQRQEMQMAFTETEESEFEFWKQPRRPPSQIKKKPRFKLGSDGHSEGLMSTTEATTSGSSMSSSSEDIASSSFSAENVALNLLRNANMKDVTLPDASELQWLVTENDAPQTLLPLPKNWNSASESETDSLDKSMRLRGTTDWAPPRPQIIFTVHPPPHLQTLMEAQKYRCAGCGMKVEYRYASTFRYCNYLGRYFCTGCHTMKKARLPQMILHRWDFSPYYVSNFSATLLESLHSDPVYNILAINPNLARKGRMIAFRNYRIQLQCLGEYLRNCKTAKHLYDEFHSFPSYYMADVDLYSLDDLIQLRFGTGVPFQIKDFVIKSIQHVLQCELCKQLGFHCELCRRNEIIFPFQITRVSRCPKCSTCYHSRCFMSQTKECPKCLRLIIRRKSSVSDFSNELAV